MLLAPLCWFLAAVALRSLVGLTAVAERASRSNAVAGLATETDVARGR